MAFPTRNTSCSPRIPTSPEILNISLPTTSVVPIPTLVNVANPTNVDTPVTFKFLVSISKSATIYFADKMPDIITSPSISNLISVRIPALVIGIVLPIPTTPVV